MLLGYAHGTEWNEVMIKREIKNVMKALDITRMPSNSEMKLVRNDSSLSNKVSKTGGFKVWAKKLGLELKDSETAMGNKYEYVALDELEELGYNVKKMTTLHPYDLLINDAIKVDVKVAKRYYYDNKNYYHTFNLEKKYVAYDFLIAYCLGNNESVEKVLIIPTFDIMDKTQLSIGKVSTYDKYKDRWDLIKEYSELIKNMKKLV